MLVSKFSEVTELKSEETSHVESEVKTYDSQTPGVRVQNPLKYMGGVPKIVGFPNNHGFSYKK